ncbi:hypothetical protein KC357_g120 [Hortaea werneckii]|nr:hypothetical protein KC357_g120 [Hortaea werneckii]
MPLHTPPGSPILPWTSPCQPAQTTVSVRSTPISKATRLLGGAFFEKLVVYLPTTSPGWAPAPAPPPASGILLPPARLVPISSAWTSSSQGRSLIVVSLTSFALGRLVVGRRDPFLGHHAGQCEPDAGGAVDPGRGAPARQPLAEGVGEVVAVVGQEVVVDAQELLGDFADNGVDFGRRAQREALQDGAAPGAAGGLEVRACPVDAGDAALVVAAVGVFAAVDHDAGVQEGTADGPEEAGEPAGLLSWSVSSAETWLRVPLFGDIATESRWESEEEVRDRLGRTGILSDTRMAHFGDCRRLVTGFWLLDSTCSSVGKCVRSRVPAPRAAHTCIRPWEVPTTDGMITPDRRADRYRHSIPHSIMPRILILHPICEQIAKLKQFNKGLEIPRKRFTPANLFNPSLHTIQAGTLFLFMPSPPPIAVNPPSEFTAALLRGSWGGTECNRSFSLSDALLTCRNLLGDCRPFFAASLLATTEAVFVCVKLVVIVLFCDTCAPFALPFCVDVLDFAADVAGLMLLGFAVSSVLELVIDARHLLRRRAAS